MVIQHMQGLSIFDKIIWNMKILMQIIFINVKVLKNIYVIVVDSGFVDVDTLLFVRPHMFTSLTLRRYFRVNVMKNKTTFYEP